MRRAELTMAIVLAICSVLLMWKSAELPIGWVPRRGPGGGAFPFWLSAGMLACCAWIIVRWVRGTSPFSRAEGQFIDAHGWRILSVGAGSLAVMIGLIHVVGVYVSVPAYLLFYMRFVGGHSWLTTVSLVLSTPVVMFMFFEITLHITLPKGVTEPMFYPLYDFFMG